MESLQNISRYRLTGELGRGGMGVVYRALDPRLDREVAIKVILFPHRVTDAERADLEVRFEREAKAAASVRHPGVITVFDSGRDGDYLFLVMELIEGESLADRLERRPLGQAEALGVVAQIAEALGAAHQRGVIHRDVTPRNVLLAKDGRVLVTDFGLARSLHDASNTLTEAGMVIGSPHYVAPERASNKGWDERSDLFSLGVILHQVVRGRLPFDAPEITSILYQIVHQDPLADEVNVGGLPGDIASLLRGSLAKDPEERIRSAEEFARQARRLEALAQAEEMEETAVVPHLQIEAKRNPKVARTWAIVLAFLVFAIAAVAWRFSQEAQGVLSVPELGDEVATISDTELETRALPASAIEGEGGGDVARSAAETVARPEAGFEGKILSDSADGAVDGGGEAQNSRGVDSRTTKDLGEELSSPASFSLKVGESVEPQEREALATAVPKTEPIPRGERDQPVEEEADPIPSLVDTFPPMLAVDSVPASISATEVVLTGRLMDDQGPVTLLVNEQPVALQPDGSFSVRQTIGPGRNVLLFVAEDASANRTLQSIEVNGPTSPGEVAELIPSDNASDSASDSRSAPSLASDAPGTLRFRDRGDGTIHDALSGVNWTKTPSPDPLTLKAAKSYCKKRVLGRQEDWILPTIEELEELSRGGAQLTSSGNPTLHFSNLKLWSESKNGSGRQWAFDFGASQRFEQLLSGSPTLRTFCVRRNQSPRDPRRELLGDSAGQSPLVDPFGGTLSNPSGNGQPPPQGNNGGNGGGNQGGNQPPRPRPNGS